MTSCWALAALLLAADPDFSRVRIPDAGKPLVLALPALPFVWELPPKTVHEIPIDGVTWVNGIPVRLRQLLVQGNAEDIGKHFLASFLKQDLYIAPRQAIDRILTGVDPQAIITYSVVLQPNAKGFTTVILGETRPLERKTSGGEALPVLPQAKGAIPVQFEGYLMLSYLVTGVPLAEAQAFYDKAFSGRGYQQQEGAWVKANERIEVTLSEQSGQVKVVVKQQRAAP